MARMLQVRNVPDDMHDELKRRAGEAGQTLTDYVQEILRRELRRPPVHEVLGRIRRRRPVDLGRPAAELLREERRGREPEEP